MQNTSWLEGQPAIFIAGEIRQVRAINQYVKGIPGYSEKQTYASGYWKA
ncbi:SIP domain-containing protein [Catenovulum sediminis]|nr:SIP domain-containing protein [Catenovulum sediminis]